MAKAPYVKFDVPKEIEEAVLSLLQRARENGKIKKGVNETTKSVERGMAKLVIIGEDVDPPEIVMHLPPLCEQKNIPYVYVKKQEDLGSACGINVSCSSAAILDAGDANEELGEIIGKIEWVRKGGGGKGNSG